MSDVVIRGQVYRNMELLGGHVQHTWGALSAIATGGHMTLREDQRPCTGTMLSQQKGLLLADWAIPE